MSNPPFSAAVAAAIETLGERGVADLFAVSPATVRRYANGTSSPHPLLLDVFLRLLENTEP